MSLDERLKEAQENFDSFHWHNTHHFGNWETHKAEAQFEMEVKQLEAEAKK